MKASRNKSGRGGDPGLDGEGRGGKSRLKPGRGNREEPEIPKQWVWHYETLSSLRERLVQERRERLTEAAEPRETHTLSPADSATDEFDHALALSRLSIDQDALYEVEAAMKRILDGTYGTCEQTGKPIPAGRLKALPWTRYRTEVAHRLERTGLNPPARLGLLGHGRLEAGRNFDGD